MTPPDLARRIGDAADDLRSEGRGPILLAVAGGWFLSLGVRLVFPAILPHLRAAFGLDLTTAGLLLTTLWVAYALGQFPGGVLGDRLGEGTVLVASTIVATGTVALLAVSSGLATLFAGTILFGLATALYGPTRYTILSDVYLERDGTAIGLTLAAGNVGNAVLPALAGVLAAYSTWRFGFGFAVPLFALTAVALWWAVPARTSPAGATTAVSVDTARRILRTATRRNALLAAGVLLINSFVWQGFTGFYPTYLIDAKGLSPGIAAALFGAFFAVGIVVQPLAGACNDRFGARPTLLAVVCPIVLGLAALPFAEGLAALVGLTLLLSSLLGTSPVAHAFLVDELADDLQGSGLGLLRTVYMSIAAVAPVVVGALADAGRFDGAFLLLAGVAVGMIALSFGLPRR